MGSWCRLPTSSSHDFQCILNFWDICIINNKKTAVLLLSKDLQFYCVNDRHYFLIKRCSFQFQNDFKGRYCSFDCVLHYSGFESITQCPHLHVGLPSFLLTIMEMKQIWTPNFRRHCRFVNSGRPCAQRSLWFPAANIWSGTNITDLSVHSRGHHIESRDQRTASALGVQPRCTTMYLSMLITESSIRANTWALSNLYMH